MSEPWTVNGVPVPDVLDEVIQWDDHETGLTQYEVNRRDHSMYVFSLVPRRNDVRGRTITRHEFLHAVHDNPRAAKDSSHSEAGYSSPVVQGVADAFVHLNYWPAGEDKQADKEAVAVATEDLHRQVHRYADDHDAALAITLRSMAILKAVGTLGEQLKGSKLVLRYLTADQLSKLNKTLHYVQQGDRSRALKLFAKMMED